VFETWDSASLGTIPIVIEETADEPVLAMIKLYVVYDSPFETHDVPGVGMALIKREEHSVACILPEFSLTHVGITSPTEGIKFPVKMNPEAELELPTSICPKFASYKVVADDGSKFQEETKESSPSRFILKESS
jgi:hypothetical protein